MTDLIARLRDELDTLSGSFEHFVRCNKRLAESNSDGNIYAWTSALDGHRALIAKTQAHIEAEPARIRAAVEAERERAAGVATSACQCLRCGTVLLDAEFPCCGTPEISSLLGRSTIAAAIRSDQ